MIALKFFLTISLLFLTLTSCVGGNANAYLGFSKSGFIKSYDSVKIRLRHLDIVNALRQENGLKNLSLADRACLALAQDTGFIIGIAK